MWSKFSALGLMFAVIAAQVPAYADDVYFDITEIPSAPFALNQFTPPSSYSINDLAGRYLVATTYPLQGGYPVVYRFSPESGVEFMPVGASPSHYNQTSIASNGAVLINPALLESPDLSHPRVWEGNRIIEINSLVPVHGLRINSNGEVLMRSPDNLFVLNYRSKTTTLLPEFSEFGGTLFNNRGSVVATRYEHGPNGTQIHQPYLSRRQPNGQYSAERIPLPEGILSCFPHELYDDDSVVLECSFIDDRISVHMVTFRAGVLEIHPEDGGSGRDPLGTRLYWDSNERTFRLERIVDGAIQTRRLDQEVRVPSGFSIFPNVISSNALHGEVEHTNRTSVPVVFTRRSANPQGNVTNRDNLDRCVINSFDLQELIAKFGKQVFDTRIDYLGDGRVDTSDLQRLVARFGQSCIPAP